MKIIKGVDLHAVFLKPRILESARLSLFDQLKARSGLDLSSPMVLSKGSPQALNPVFLRLVHEANR
jgi:hypothetical protein